SSVVLVPHSVASVFSLQHPPTPMISTLSLHDALPISWLASKPQRKAISVSVDATIVRQFCRYLHRLPAHSSLSEPRWPQLPGKRSEEHTSELQSHLNLVCRLLLEKKNK